MWAHADVPRHYDKGAGSMEALRASGTFEILTPDEALTHARRRLGEGRFHPIIHPLAGNMPIDHAWRGLELFVDGVLGRL